MCAQARCCFCGKGTGVLKERARGARRGQHPTIYLEKFGIMAHVQVHLRGDPDMHVGRLSDAGLAAGAEFTEVLVPTYCYAIRHAFARSTAVAVVFS